MVSEAASKWVALSDDVKAFRNYMQSERGMAENTVLAYGHDLDRDGKWVTGDGLSNYLQPTVRELGHYLVFLKEEGLAHTSIATHLIALKMFYRFLRLEARADQRAVELLSSPRCGNGYRTSWFRERGKAPHRAASQIDSISGQARFSKLCMRPVAGRRKSSASNWPTCSSSPSFASAWARAANSVLSRWDRPRSRRCGRTWKNCGPI